MAAVKKRKLLAYFVAAAFALCLSVVLNSFPLYYLEFLAYDAVQRLKPDADVSGHIQTIAIDRKTFSELGHAPNFKDHADLLEFILAQNPKAVLYTVDKDKIEGNIEDFGKVVKKSNQIYYAMNEILIDGNSDKFRFQAPLDNIKAYPGIVSSDKTNFAADDVSRRSIITYEGIYFVHGILAQLITGPKADSSYHGAFVFRETYQTLTQIRKSSTYKAISFYDIVSAQRFQHPSDEYFHKSIANRLKDKIVIIGQDADLEADDYVRTPLSRETVAMSKLEYHANAIDTLIMDNGIAQSPSWLNKLICILAALVAIGVTFFLNPLHGVMCIFALLLSLFSSSLFLISFFNIWLPIAHSVIVIFICYYFFIPYRLIVESQKNWEYEQKHKLMLRVEELKNNFIGMVSHDLKTPLARIQGMAYMAMNDKNTLSENQSMALQCIGDSTQDLSRFVDSVLNLNRIENQNIKLNLQERDINKIIENTIQKLKYIADKKQIQINTELEPMFPIKLDPDLIQQSVQNLIENAIKYSPNGSSILVCSEELDGQVQIQVADQGSGIANEDLENIFMKFYRSKDAKISTVKGSGLGLYLSHYFVRLHRGDIKVESEMGMGSTFSLYIPNNLNEGHIC